MSFANYTAPLIQQWSYSRFTTYTECPLKARLKFIERLKEPGNEAMDRGTKLHNLAELYLKEPAPMYAVLPDELAQLREPLKCAKEQGAEAELELAFNRAWEPVGWFDKSCWLRVKADIVIGPVGDDLTIVDLKTGKQRDYTKQLELYALAAFKQWPELQHVMAEVWYIDHGTVEAVEFNRGQEADLTAAWEAAVKPMLSDDIYAPRPGQYCRWCHFRKMNGGPCKL